MFKKSKKFTRVLLKISGEVLGENGDGISSKPLNKIAKEIVDLNKKGVQVVVVNGGGNIWRYRDNKEAGIERSTSDYMGMLATIMNAVALQSAIEKLGKVCNVFSSINIPQLTQPFIRKQVIKKLEKGSIVICAGGTGNPYFTTDTAAALRAIELNC